MKNSRPKQHDNSWLGNTVTQARLRIIDETQDPPRWKDVGSCMDTPNSIQAELKQAHYKGLHIWIFDAFGNKRYYGQIK